METESNIRVICRFRPPLDNELLLEECFELNSSYGSVIPKTRDGPSVFNYDNVFCPLMSQEQVFLSSAGNVIDDMINGFNATIFAYGQTGSGKTFTMMGELDSSDSRGIAPRLVDGLFERIFKSSEEFEFTVKVSFMEIYMERVRDLLNPSANNLPIHEDAKKGVYVKGLQEIFVGGAAEVMNVMKKGDISRSVRSTNMNQASSRSHSIFTIVLTQKNLNTLESKTSKLSLVDLAGSEKVRKSGATGQTLEEAKKINKSLSALGLVINSLTDGNSPHIPYRDSKLTRILQESLGGNSRTTLIITCNQSSEHVSETMSTLRFGIRAKMIKNNAKVNFEPNPSELKELLKQSKEECRRLQIRINGLGRELEIWRSGKQVQEKDRFTFNQESIIVNTASVTNASLKSELDDLMEKNNALEDELVQKENLIDKLKDDVGTSQKLLTSSQNECEKIFKEKEELKLELEHLELEKKDKSVVLEGLHETIGFKDSTIHRLEAQINSLEEELKARTQSIISNAVIENKRISDIVARVLTKPIVTHIATQTESKRTEQVETQTEIAEKTITIGTSPILQGMQDLTSSSSSLELLKEKDAQIASLRGLLSEHVEQNESLQKYFYEIVSNQNTSQLELEVKQLKKDIKLQAADFDAMRNKLFSDLTAQHQKEADLVQAIELLKKSSTKSMVDTKRLNSLQSEVVQLQSANQQLIDENNTLKSHLKINDRMLETRNKRITALEQSSLDLQSKQAREKKEQPTLTRLEKQWKDADRRVQELSMKDIPWVQSSKILKPLRGGMAPAAESPTEQNLEAPPRRSSWYISLLKHNK